MVLPGYLQPTEEEIRIVSRSTWSVDIEIADFVEPISFSNPEAGTSAPSTNSNGRKTLAYTSDGDANGVCYWIGTDYGAKLKFSSLFSCKPVYQIQSKSKENSSVNFDNY